MKQNITLSIDKELIKKAKLVAAQRQISVSGLLRNELRRIIEDAEGYDLAERKAMNNLKKGFHFGGKGVVCREDLHGR